MKKIIGSSLVLAAMFGAWSCQKMERPALGDYAQDTNDPNGPLRFYTAFDGTTANPLMNAVDSIRASFPSDNPFETVDGITGNAVQGSTTNNKAIKYASPNDFAKATSFTIAFWMKHQPTPDGAQFVFAMPKAVDKSGWTTNTETFMLIEDNSPDRNHSTADSAAVKFALKDHWFEFIGDKRITGILDNSWHHMAITYDENSSEVKFYVDGQEKTSGLPAGFGDMTNNGAPYGKMNFSNVTGFAVGGWSQHIGLPGPGDNPTPGGESWAKAFSGALDQFRLYNEALSASDVQALYNSKL